MMIRSEQETDNFSKEESKTSHDHDHEDTKNKGTTSTSSSWSRLKDPRIVRVSKAFGGKDRHSKVCTVRGLRDRRVRLSVPTAIQLYDLQERLGLNQPSKVVDWLLNAAKNEIDELPPLQIPPGTFSTLADFDQPKQGQLSQVSGENSTDQEEEIRQFNMENAFITTSGTTTSSSSSVSNLMNNNSFIRWDPSNLTLSSSSGAHRNDQDYWQNFSQTISHHHHHQVLVYHQPGISTRQSYFSQNISTDQQMNFHNSPVESTNATTHFNIMSTANLLPSRNNEGRS